VAASLLQGTNLPTRTSASNRLVLDLSVDHGQSISNTQNPESELQHKVQRHNLYNIRCNGKWSLDGREVKILGNRSMIKLRFWPSRVGGLFYGYHPPTLLYHLTIFLERESLSNPHKRLYYNYELVA